jgi:hypothetical protein
MILLIAGPLAAACLNAGLVYRRSRSTTRNSAIAFWRSEQICSDGRVGAPNISIAYETTASCLVPLGYRLSEG